MLGVNLPGSGTRPCRRTAGLGTRNRPTPWGSSSKTRADAIILSSARNFAPGRQEVPASTRRGPHPFGGVVCLATANVNSHSVPVTILPMDPTMIELVRTRDVWDILVIVFTILTGGILAVAATLAFALQRARYLEETEPHLAFAMDAPRISILDSDLAQREGVFDFDFAFWVENQSNYPARDVKIACTLWHRGAQGDARDYQMESPWGEILPRDIFAGGRWRLRFQRRTDPINHPTTTDFSINVELAYGARRHFLLVLMLPLTLGKRSFSRTARTTWMIGGSGGVGNITWTGDVARS